MSKQLHPRESEQEGSRGRGGVPRWPAAIALLVVGATYATISERLKLGSSGLLLGVVAVVLVLIGSTRLSGYIV